MSQRLAAIASALRHCLILPFVNSVVPERSTPPEMISPSAAANRGCRQQSYTRKTLGRYSWRHQ